MSELPALHSLILASSSPRRAQLLRQIGVSFTPITAPVEEIRWVNEQAQQYVQRLAREKAVAACELIGGSAEQWFLGADTLISCGQEVLEKPRDQDDFTAMMQRLSGRAHLVLTAIHLYGKNRSFTELVQTQVQFRSLSARLINAYWQTGEPIDKAGGYAIQGMGALLIKSINGSYSNVVGLPLEALAPILQKANIPYWQSEK